MLRILCLHGHQQTAEIFENQIHKLRQSLSDTVEWVFLDAPYELPRTHVEDDVCTRSWSAPSDPRHANAVSDAQYAAADRMVEDAVANEAFDLLFGFSQGALVLYRFLMRHWDHQRHALESRYGSVKGFMVAGAPDPRRAFANGSTLLVDFVEKSEAASRVGFFGTQLASLHMVGRKDTIVSPSESEGFAEACGARAQLFTHEHAHSVPQLQAALRAIKRFVEEVACAEDPETAAAALEARSAELEMLASMYEDSVRHPDHPGGATVQLPLLTGVEDRVRDAHVAAALAHLQVQFHVPRRYPNVLPDVSVLGGTSAHSVRLEKWRTALLDKAQLFMQEDVATGTAMLLPIYLFISEKAEETFDELQGIYSAADGDGNRHDQFDEATSTARQDAWAMEDDDSRAALIEEAEQQAALILAASHRRGDARKNSTTGTGFEESDAARTANTTASSSSSAAMGGMIKQSGGTWDLTIGLIGKPSAGKSTFFNAVTDPESESAAARVAAFPFTTIEPNVGTAFGGLRCPCQQLCPTHEEASSSSSPSLLKLGRETCDAEYGHVRAHGHDHYRRHPIRVKDVAGLVQGAYQGKGKGNQFLNDLCDADVLVHVVDGAAATEADGTACAPGQGSALEDIGWVRAEVHSWIYDNIKAKWSTIFRLPQKLRSMFSGYRSSPAFVDGVLRLIAIHDETELSARVREWGPRELHLFIALYVRLRFPMVVALNKADLPTAEALVEQLHARYPHEIFIPMTAVTEWNLLRLRKRGYVRYISGEATMTLTEAGEALQSHVPTKPSRASGNKSGDAGLDEEADPLLADSKRLRQVQAFFEARATPRCTGKDAPDSVTPLAFSGGAASPPLLHLDGSTGVQNVVVTALEACAMQQVVPVSAFQPHVPSLKHCFTFKQGTTAEDVFWAMTYAKLLDGKLVRCEAIDATRSLSTPAEIAPIILKREATMPSRSVLVRILSNKRQMN